jgi:hypothetical protein
MPHVQERMVLHAPWATVPLDLYINVEVQIEMSSSYLHSKNPAFYIEAWSTTLPPETRCADLKSDDCLGARTQVTSHHTLDRESRGVAVPLGCPSQFITLSIILIVGKLGEWKTKPAHISTLGWTTGAEDRVLWEAGIELPKMQQGDVELRLYLDHDILTVRNARK